MLRLGHTSRPTHKVLVQLFSTEGIPSQIPEAMTNDTKTQVMVIEGWATIDRDYLECTQFVAGCTKREAEFSAQLRTEHGLAGMRFEAKAASLIIGERGYSRTQMLAMVEEIVAKQAEYEEPDWVKAIADKHLGTDL